MPTAGGWYVYARRAFGDYGGFVVGWSDWLSSCAAIAFVAITIGEYLPKLFPTLAGSINSIALTVLLVFGLFNWLGLRVGSRVQEVTSFAKALAFLLLIAACFIYGGQTPASAEPAATLNAPIGFAAMFVAVMLALQSVIYTYDGWYAAIYFAEENRDPARNLPRAMLFGVVSVMAIYLLVNLAFLYILPMAQFAASDLPAGDAAQAVFGTYGGQIISVIALISLASIINGNLMMSPRVLFSMSRDNLFWSKAALVNKGGTPVWALFLTSSSGSFWLPAARSRYCFQSLRFFSSCFTRRAFSPFSFCDGGNPNCRARSKRGVPLDDANRSARLNCFPHRASHQRHAKQSLRHRLDHRQLSGVFDH